MNNTQKIIKDALGSAYANPQESNFIYFVITNCTTAKATVDETPWDSRVMTVMSLIFAVHSSPP